MADCKNCIYNIGCNLSRDKQTCSYFRPAWTVEYGAPPIADMVEVKHGTWLPHPNGEAYKEWDVCSVCGTGTKRREYGTNPDGTEWTSTECYRYCPWCGAKMYKGATGT